MDIPLKGKNALITGATSGIGLETARQLSRLGGQVTILSRDAEKCANVAARIGSETGHPVEWIAADLSSLEGIMHAAMTFKQRHTHLHILVNNAGGLFTRRTLTPDGLEKTFALNHINYFLLTILLLDLLKTSSPARIVNVSSRWHEKVAVLDFDNLQGEKKYSGDQAYARSKLCNLLFTYELARRLQGSGVTVNALHPGYVNTGFALNNGLVYQVFAKGAASIFAQKPAQGAQTSIFLASSPEVESVTGKYYAHCKETSSSPASHDGAAADKLWQISLELTGKAN
jgi:NAD(P)-dependent dehydrogenase (short-subunit alcohol dehydrogenase family)